jgi:iron(III) transport system permease protein
VSVGPITARRQTLRGVAIPLLDSVRLNPVRVSVVAAVTVMLFLLVLRPIGYIAYNSLHDDASGSWTLANYEKIVFSATLLRPILNSLILGLAIATISVSFGVPVAWLVARTNMPAREWVAALTLTAFVTPTFIGALGWILMAAPNSGWINLLWRKVTGTDWPVLDIYSMGGAIFVGGIYAVPFAFTIVGTALDEMAVELEDAATTLSSGTLRTMFRITLPMAAPAIYASFILSFIQGVTLFGVPAFLLTPVRISVVTTKLAEFYQAFPPEIFLAAAYCTPLLGLTAILFYIRKRLLGRKQFVMISGKARGGRRIDIGRWRWPALAIALFVPLVAVILPYATLLAISLSKAWGVGLRPDNLTLDWYAYALFRNSQTRTAIVNTLLYAGGSATLCIFLGAIIAYIVERRLIRGAAWLGGLASIPIVIPGIVLSVGFFAAYTQPPLRLYGTAAILIAAFSATFLPIAYAHAGALLKGISRDLERAARAVGAGEARTFALITFPLMRVGLLSGWLLVFIPVTRELSVAIFLVTPSTNVMATLIYNFQDGGNYEAVCALSVLLLIVTFAIVLGARYVSVRLAGARSQSLVQGSAT